MYGMVNNAIRGCIIEDHGTEAWARVCERAGIDRGEFAAVLPYDDAVSLQIIGEASATVGVPVDALLRKIGRYWVHYAANSSFGSLLAFGGGHFEEFLGNLDAMHSKIKSSLPKLEPPSFRVETRDDDVVCVTYRSSREGLFPFVEGLFEGLSERFGQSVKILSFEQIGPGAARWDLRVGRHGARRPAA